MARISINELVDVLGKSGLPLNDAMGMQNAAPFAQDPVRQQVYGQDTQLPGLQNKYRGQLDKIAQLDQQLASTYGDPTSKLYIENPMNRERLKQGASRVSFQGLEDTKQQVKQRTSDLDKDVNDAVSLYGKLVAMQKRIEKQTKGKGKAKKKTSIDMNKQPLDWNDKEVEQYKKDTGRNITDKANIYDTKARDLFLSKPSAFQKLWIRHQLESGEAPKGGFKPKDIEANFKEWEKTYKPKTEKQKKEEAKKTKRFQF